MQCELRQVLPQATKCKLFVIVDMDNWGFADMATPQTQSSWLLQQAERVFVWGFVGAKTREHVAPNLLGIWDHLQNDPFNALEHDKYMPPKSMFDAYGKAKHVRVSNCGFKKQASDIAMLKICEILQSVWFYCYYLHFTQRLYVAVITHDKNLKDACAKLNTSMVKTFSPQTYQEMAQQLESFYVPKLN